VIAHKNRPSRRRTASESGIEVNESSIARVFRKQTCTPAILAQSPFLFAVLCSLLSLKLVAHLAEPFCLQTESAGFFRHIDAIMPQLSG